jgi:hypothetical protein
MGLAAYTLRQELAVTPLSGVCTTLHQVVEWVILDMLVWGKKPSHRDSSQPLSKRRFSSRRTKGTRKSRPQAWLSWLTTSNPDAPTREVLAKQLGPEIKPKTLQIWFQNR